MTPAQERILNNVERLLKVLIAERQQEWISETEVMILLQRSKCWLKIQRNGLGDVPPTLIKEKDWRYINGRTPEYKHRSILELKKLLNIRISKHTKLGKIQAS